MPPNRFESEVESFLEGSHGDRTHIKRADHHTVTPLCGTLLRATTHPDRKPTSGYLNNLSGCAQPIRMRTTYPDNPKQKPRPGPQRSQRATHTPTSHQPTAWPPSPQATSPPPGRQPAPGRQHIRIGNQHPDRKPASGYLNNLSGCAQPIRMRTTYPDNPKQKPHPGPRRSQRATHPPTSDPPTDGPPAHPRATSPPRAADTTGRQHRDTAPAPAATPYNPRNALIAGISRTAWTRPAR